MGTEPSLAVRSKLSAFGLDIYEREFVALGGGSGSGKSIPSQHPGRPLKRVENLILPLSSHGQSVDHLLIGTAPVECARAMEWHPPERRRAPRIAILCSGVLQIGSEQESCVVLDYPFAGARLQLEHPVVSGDPIVIAFAEFPPRAARIIWQRTGHARFRFAEV